MKVTTTPITFSQREGNLMDQRKVRIITWVAVAVIGLVGWPAIFFLLGALMRAIVYVM
jgi:hypothetical protein